jgi:hypothetical protein
LFRLLETPKKVEAGITRPEVPRPLSTCCQLNQDLSCSPSTFISAVMRGYLDDPDEHYKPGDVIMSLSGDSWAKLFLSQATVTELVKSKEIEMKRGTADEAERLINLFDKYRPEKDLLVAPHLHD